MVLFPCTVTQLRRGEKLGAELWHGETVSGEVWHCQQYLIGRICVNIVQEINSFAVRVSTHHHMLHLVHHAGQLQHCWLCGCAVS